MLLLIGSDEALLEGLVQLLAGAGHRVATAATLQEARESCAGTKPLLVVVDRPSVAADTGDVLASLPHMPGGAIVLYRTTDEPKALTALPHGVARLTLADLTLPLERQRLVALAQYVKVRARESGRVRFDTPPERRLP